MRSACAAPRPRTEAEQRRDPHGQPGPLGPYDHAEHGAGERARPGRTGRRAEQSGVVVADLFDPQRQQEERTGEQRAQQDRPNGWMNWAMPSGDSSRSTSESTVSPRARST
ncbi:hypothetical protein F5X71_15285 [Nocardia brasiliensis]|uniref:Uncharacterized protein n=1 Tax=Nocardia brasiliensis TaxID=37326 RepID=A0A6G9XRC9_NOCBR|nr:hypothetical protein [Nocardia brasiliensis]QIS03502.1 hypothetical protein F5X71_15285 [Nocardia brasiliensis]